MNTVTYAGFWIRLIASVIDWLILALVSWAVQLGLSYVIDVEQLLALAIYVALAAPYYIVGHYRWGMTVGKKVAGIELKDAHQELEAITLTQSTIRFLAYAASYVFLGTGYFVAAFHPRKQALHDLLAGTICVRSSI